MGIENEPGSFDDPTMRQDKAFGGKLGDTITDRFFPEVVLPFSEGVRRANPDITLVGPEADSYKVLDRLCSLDDARYKERPSLSCYDVLSVHPYGDIEGGDYRTMESFVNVLDFWKSRRRVCIGEIDGDPQTLLDWTKATVAKYPRLDAIFFHKPERFCEAGSWPTAPVVSAIGRQFQKVFAEAAQ